MPSGFRQNTLVKRIIKHFPLYFFVLPAIIYFAVFSYVPMYGVQIAFRNYNPALGVTGSRWVGLKHFKDFFASYYFVMVFRNTLTVSIYMFIAGFPIPVFLALILNELRHQGYKRFCQTVMYAPHFISMVVMCGMIILFLSPSAGIINKWLEYFGIEGQYFMSSGPAFKHIYVWSGVWQSMGWSTIIYLAALSNVDPTHQEAATIDGASRIQKIWHINIPVIIPTVTILMILRIGELVGVGFEKAYLLKNSLNSEYSMVISTYVYERAFGVNAGIGSMSFSAAINLFNNIINVILLLVANFLAGKVGETSLF